MTWSKFAREVRDNREIVVIVAAMARLEAVQVRTVLDFWVGNHVLARNKDYKKFLSRINQPAAALNDMSKRKTYRKK